MKPANRKKLATIKKKIIGGQYGEMGKQAKGKGGDPEYREALRILGKAIDDVESFCGSLD